MCPSPSSALCPLLYRTALFRGAEKGENVPRKGEEGWPEKGGKRKKRTHENRSAHVILPTLQKKSVNISPIRPCGFCCEFCDGFSMII